MSGPDPFIEDPPYVYGDHAATCSGCETCTAQEEAYLWRKAYKELESAIRTHRDEGMSLRPRGSFIATHDARLWAALKCLMCGTEPIYETDYDYFTCKCGGHTNQEV